MDMEVTYRGTQADLATLFRDRAEDYRDRQPTRANLASAAAWDAAADIVDHWAPAADGPAPGTVAAPAAVDGRVKAGRPVADAPQA